jgi:hypothetical protein
MVFLDKFDQEHVRHHDERDFSTSECNRRDRRNQHLGTLKDGFLQGAVHAVYEIGHVVDLCPGLKPRPKRTWRAVASNELNPGTASDKKADVDSLDWIVDVLGLLSVTQSLQSSLVWLKRTADQANMVEFGSVKHGYLSFSRF